MVNEENSKIFVGGLSYSTSEEVLRTELIKYGEVKSLRIILDHDTGKSKGYGFRHIPFFVICYQFATINLKLADF